ncbi:hypothetical protein [Vibrio parahaemolyticus]|uniref:hypothetical protein n=1 Tax=Vibrio parahaemolyticus TaxID=670 RepID=UPI00111EC270|nr:hypothetical protein [Vibrio parahaemolyticus]TOA03002.1 hypothetical protein CGK35_15490 [Vibrio parahaemolyticus]
MLISTPIGVSSKHGFPVHRRDGSTYVVKEKSIESGVRNSVLTDVLSSGNKAGHKITTFADLYFQNQVVVIPDYVDAGRVLDEKNFEVQLWNTGLEDVTLEEIVGDGFDGLTLEIDVPSVIPRLKVVSYNLKVLASGASVINARATLKFDKANNSYLDVVGERQAIWEYEPDWTDGIEHAIEHKTTVLEAWGGEEERTALRTKPRQSYSYSFLFTDNKLRSAINRLKGYQYGEWCVPAWQLKVEETFEQDSNVIIYPRFLWNTVHVGSQLLFKNNTTTQVSTVAAISDKEITLTEPLRDDFNLAVPLLTGHLEEKITHSLSTSVVSRLNLNFKASPVSDLGIQTKEWTSFYKNIPFLDVRANWMENPAFTQDVVLREADYEVGGFYKERKSSFETAQFLFSCFSKEETQYFLDFLMHIKGRYETFWYPTLRHDLNILDSNPASKTITVENCYYSSYTHANYKHLYFLMIDGSIELREVVKATARGNTELLELDSALPELAVEQCSLLHKCRFVSDESRFYHKTDEVAEITKTLKILNG